MKIAMLTVLRNDILQHYNKAKEIGMEIDILTKGQEPTSLFSSRRFIELNSLNERIYRSEDELFKILKEYDIIQTYEFYGPRQLRIMETFDNFVGEIAWNVPTYGTWWYKRDKEWAPQCLELAKTKALGFIAKSQSVYDCLIQEGIPKTKIKLLHGSVDTEIFKPRPKQEWKNKKVVLFVGRISYQKGIYDIFHSFVRANIKDSVLIYLGPHNPENEDVKMINRWAEKLGITEKIKFVGEIDGSQIHTFYNWGDIFITLPNADLRFVEQIGLTVPQALASGLPVLSYNYGGQSDFIDDTCGKMVNYRDYASAGDWLKKILSNDKLRKEISYNARQKAVKEFNSKLFCTNIMNIYSKWLKQ